MGILDDAIRDHLDLKRRRGADEPELKRLEDEAFGPPGRPDASGADAAIASALAAPSADTAVGSESGLEAGESAPKPNGDAASPLVAETQTPDAPAPEAPPAPPEPETGDDEGEDGGETEPPGTSSEVVFHDFAAEAGLVEAPREPDVEAPLPGEQVSSEPATSESPAAETAASEPVQEPRAPEVEDTQVHDMERELGLADDAAVEQRDHPAAPPPAETTPEEESELGAMELEELEVELDEEELEPPSEDLESDELEIPEPGDDEGDDVLEETPEFLRDAPESDRLWFEQGQPKDFDFDEDDE